MLKYLISFILLVSLATAEGAQELYEDEDDTNTTITENIQESDLYLSYETLPTKIYHNQIFTLTTKVLNTNKEDLKIQTSYGSFYGVKPLTAEPTRVQNGFTFYDTYYFQATDTKLKTPDLLYSLNRGPEDIYEPTKLKGHQSFAVQLNEHKDFCHVLANELSINYFKTTDYDQQNNIIVFTASSEFANLADFNLSVASIQGIKSMDRTLPYAEMTYFAVIPKHLRSVNFNYFNLQSGQYIPLTIPVEVDDDSVSTQMDLSPTQYNHSFAKIMIALALILLGIILYFITRQKRYFFLIALSPILYVAWVYFPKEKLCIKSDANIYLLPMTNSTVFQKSSFTQQLQKLGKVDNYNKVLLQNLNIGWIKDEDLCED